MEKTKISATIITYNEEQNIERCLKSLQWVSEIIVVDSFSTDNTMNICKKYNCNIIQTEWKGFGKTKKFAVDNTSNDWILSIDADEEVSDSLRNAIEQLLVKPTNYGFNINRRSFYLGKEIKYCGWNKDYPLRLFNKKYGNFNENEIHEYVKLKINNKSIINEPIYHYTYPTISSHFFKIGKYSDIISEKFIKEGKRYSIVAAIFFGIVKFINMYFVRLGFLDGRVGFILCLNSSIGVYLKYIKTWQKKK